MFSHIKSIANIMGEQNFFLIFGKCISTHIFLFGKAWKKMTSEEQVWEHSTDLILCHCCESITIEHQKGEYFTRNVRMARGVGHRSEDNSTGHRVIDHRPPCPQRRCVNCPCFIPPHPHTPCDFCCHRIPPRPWKKIATV